VRYGCASYADFLVQVDGSRSPRRREGSLRGRALFEEGMDVTSDLEFGNLLDAAFSTSPDAVVVIDASHQIVLASPAVTVIFQYSAEELVGEPLELLIPNSRRERHAELLGDYFRSPQARQMGVGLELSGRRRDGSEIPVDVSLTPVSVEGREYVAAFVRDASERRRAVDQLHAVNEITQRLLAGSQMEDILPIVAERARILSNSDAAWILMPRSDAEFEIVAADGPGTERLLGFRLSTESSRSAEVMNSGASKLTDDLSSAPNIPEGVVALDLGPGLYVPFVTDTRSLGTLALGRRHGESSFQPLDVAFAELFASSAATAIVMGSVRSEVERLNVVAEDERIARDLHDTVIQELFVLGMSLQAVGTTVKGPVGDRIATAVDALDDVIRQIRNTIFRLPVRAQAHPGLREDMLRLADKYRDELGVLPRISFLGPVDSSVTDLVSEHLLHVFSEGLSNIARHAHASRIDAVVALEGAWLAFSLMDDGVGVNDGPSAGNGIRNMSTRAENLGGTCTVTRRVPKGSIVEWRVPLSL